MFTTFHEFVTYFGNNSEDLIIYMKKNLSCRTNARKILALKYGIVDTHFYMVYDKVSRGYPVEVKKLSHLRKVFTYYLKYINYFIVRSSLCQSYEYKVYRRIIAQRQPFNMKFADIIIHFELG